MTGRRIVYFANASVPSRTANSVHIMKMCEAMGKAGHEVVLLIPDCGEAAGEGEDEFSLYGVERCFSLRKIGWMKSSPVGLRNYLFAAYAGLYVKLVCRPGIVVTRNPIAAVLFPLLRIPTIAEFHKPLEHRLVIGRLATLLDVFRNRFVLKLVVVSGSLREEFARARCPSEKIQVLPDAANTNPAEAAGETDGRGRLQVGYVGSLYRGRGIEIILGLAGRNPAIDFWVIGGSAEESDAWRRETGGLANVNFRGHVPNREVPAILASMDVLVMPYQRKVAISGNTDDTARWMSPMKMFEYMAAGKPIIASDLDVLKEVLIDGENCLLAVPEDPESWHRALRRLADEPETARKLGATARKQFLEAYTWEKRAQRMFADIPDDGGRPTGEER